MSQEDGGAGMEEDEVQIAEGSRFLYDIDFSDSVDSPLKDISLKPGSILHVGQDNDDGVDLVLESM